MKHVKGVKIVPPKNDVEALALVASFIAYIFGHPVSKVALTVWTLFGVNAYFHVDNATTEKAKIGLATPPTSQNTGLRLMPEAFAGVLGDTIKLGGVFWGINDPNYQCWKLMGKPTILIYGRTEGKMFSIDAPGLSQSRLQKIK